MFSDPGPALVVKDLRKCYRIFNRPQDRLKQGFFRHQRYFREFWALRGVSFSVKKGETLGIIGHNGSGKSTLLRMIAGTLAPSGGKVVVSGRVAALLELGSGFNLEFKGRENVFMNGAILGLTRQEMERPLEEIVAFAELGDFLEQPVRTYSSGMVDRLAFAVQGIVPKDLLIVDKALAGGDEAFQRKCFAKIGEFTENGGTVLFVSNVAGLAVELCDRVIFWTIVNWFIRGQSKHVVALYQRLIYAPPAARGKLREELRVPSWEDLLDQQASQHQVGELSEIEADEHSKAALPGRTTTSGGTGLSLSG